jgi:hypothetical protein
MLYFAKVNSAGPGWQRKMTTISGVNARGGR